jgi:hypothetical protein
MLRGAVTVTTLTVTTLTKPLIGKYQQCTQALSFVLQTCALVIVPEGSTEIKDDKEYVRFSRYSSLNSCMLVYTFN